MLWKKQFKRTKGISISMGVKTFEKGRKNAKKEGDMSFSEYLYKSTIEFAKKANIHPKRGSKSQTELHRVAFNKYHYDEVKGIAEALDLSLSSLFTIVINLQNESKNENNITETPQ